MDTSKLDLGPLAQTLDDIGTAYFESRIADRAAAAAENTTPYIVGAVVLLIGLYFLRK